MSEHELKTEMVPANGLTFEVLTCGSGDTLALCLHGFPEVSLSWREQMLALASAGYRVWAPNQRGYGKSSRPPRMQDYAIEHLMQDVAALIDASQATSVVLLGHDWGGLVAWCFASRALRPLEKLVVINVPHPLCFARSFRHPQQLMRSWYMAAFHIPRLPEWFLARNSAKAIEEAILRTSTSPTAFPRDLLAATRANAAQPGALKAMVDWYRAFLLGGGMLRQWRQRFPIIRIPTLLLWGEEDTFLSKLTLKGTGNFAFALTIHLLPGVSHWPQQDATDKCNQQLLYFLGRKKDEAAIGRIPNPPQL